MPTPEEFRMSVELMDERPTEPDDLAFWRGLVVGGCTVTAFWIVVACVVLDAAGFGLSIWS